MSTVKLSVAELRRTKGVTQSELADYLGVSFQSVSKWENGTTMPDITLLPKLAEYFQVSVDEILGLKPLSNREYMARGTNREGYWDKKLDYLKSSRTEFWNDDYLEFLVTKVWKITKPVNVIDFGCGFGFMGMLLLPILPRGSTYTGVDISDTLLDEAKGLFKDSKYTARFIKSDLNMFKTEEKYDIAICQTLLRHLPNPKDILRKMIDAVSCGGMVVCIEVNREFENIGLYINGMDYSSNSKTPILQKLWKSELELEGRDYSIGMKVPFYMQELGLHDVDVRLNDKISFINPYGDKNRYNQQLNSIIKANNWDKSLTDDDKEDIIKLFMNNNGNAFALKTLGLLISYGTK